MMNGQEKSATTTVPNYMKDTATSQNRKRSTNDNSVCRVVQSLSSSGLSFFAKVPIVETDTTSKIHNGKIRTSRGKKSSTSSLNRNGTTIVAKCDSDESHPSSSSFRSDYTTPEDPPSDVVLLEKGDKDQKWTKMEKAADAWEELRGTDRNADFDPSENTGKCSENQ
eukprot:GHVP01064813.1.p1 GENE.GHVP01064813.1~~GHVP01064813.1.p1  ORF type:complete len:167 (+),score=35.41 GHVP01064813.1:613-1113(+)